MNLGYVDDISVRRIEHQVTEPIVLSDECNDE